MPAERHVGLVGHLVVDDQSGERQLDGLVVDDAGVRLAFDVVDERLVDRPGVDLALDRLDRAVVEAERLGHEIGRARGGPRLARGGERLVGRIGEQRVNGAWSILRFGGSDAA